MSERNWTPTPWKMDQYGDIETADGTIEVATTDGMSKEDIANAARIVHCVNTYDALVDAIEQALDNMRNGHCVYEATKKMLVDALALAEGTKNERA